MSDEHGSDDYEQEFVTVDGGVEIFDDAAILHFEATDAAVRGSFLVEFTTLRSVVLHPDGNDRGSIEFEVATTDDPSGRTVERTLAMRVSADEGLAEARIVVPKLNRKSAGVNATANPDLDLALNAADSESIWRSRGSEQVETTPPTVLLSAAAAPRPLESTPAETPLPAKSSQLRSRTRPLIGPVVAVAVAAAISLVIFYPRQDSEPQQATAPPVQTAVPTTSTAPTTTATPRAASPTAARQTTANAGSIDALFAETLTDLGVDYSSAAQAASVAKTTCRTIDNSANPANAILAASEIAQRSGGYTQIEANDFVGLAVLVYCPEYNEYVRN